MAKRCSRTLSLILCAAMLCSSFLSCSEEGAQNSDETAADSTGTESTEATVTETEEEKKGPDLPEVNYGGYEFRMLGKGQQQPHWQSKDLTAEEMNGEPINDAVYERNAYVGDKYGVKFIEYAVADYFSQQTEFSQSVNAGTDEYDMAALKPEGVVSSFINNGYLIA